jgi:hypothetical protein
MHFATFEVIPMRRDHRVLSQPVAVVAFVLAFAAPAGAADLLPYEEGCGYGCGGRAAGYAYAESNNLSDSYQCQGRGPAFFAGCTAFVEEHYPQAYGGQPYGGQPYAGGQPYGAQPYGAQPYGGQPYGGGSYGAQPYAAPDAGDSYAAPAIGPNNGYGPPEEQYDEPVEQGDGSSVY